VGAQDDFIATQGALTMKRPLSSRLIAAAVLAAAAFGAASTAQARPDIQVSIGLPGLPFFVQPPMPVYVRTEPVYVQPRPVYVPAPAVAYERPWRPSYRPDFERERTWRHAEWQRHEWERREWEHRHHDRFPTHGRGWD
jgi:hypothetical protein